MERRMNQVEVKTNKEGTIEISQADYGGEDDTIFLHVEQIDPLIQWLQEAKEEINGEDATAGAAAVEFLRNFGTGLLSPDHPQYEEWVALKERIGGA
jgi:hypothetical protein